MRIKDGFVMKETAGVGIVVDMRRNELSFNALITLNDTGIFLWKLLMQETDREKLLSALLDEYDVTAETAEADLNDFTSKLRDAGLLCE